MLAVHKHQGRYSVCCEEGIICQDAYSAAAFNAIKVHVEGINADEIFKLLDNPSPPEVYRTVFASALGRSVLDLEADILSLPNAETVTDIANRQARLFTAVAGLQRELLRSGLKTKIKELEAAVEALALKCVAALAERGIEAGADVASWNAAMSSDLGLQLVELRERLNET